MKPDDDGKRATVYLPADLRERAEVRRRDQGRSFSNYVQQLIRKDIERGREDVEQQEVTA